MMWSKAASLGATHMTMMRLSQTAVERARVMVMEMVSTMEKEQASLEIPESPLISHRLGQSSDTFNGSRLSNGSFCGNGSPRALPLSSTLVDELFQGMDRRGLVSPSSHLVGSRSANCSPVMSSFHKTNSLNHPEQIRL